MKFYKGEIFPHHLEDEGVLKGAGMLGLRYM